MIKNLTKEQREEFSKVIGSLGQSLDISETQYYNLVKSYETVGKWLQDDKQLSAYKPVVSPQGSLRLGTIIRPISEEDDMDVDLVFRFTDKNTSWTQKTIKNLVGARLKEHIVYNEMLDEEGKRCWTLLYRQDSPNAKERYHMDILPCVATNQYLSELTTLSRASFNVSTINKVSISITDTEDPKYSTSTNTTEWKKSNPDGYALWFADRCKANQQLRSMLTEDIMPIGKYKSNKTTLQRIVQILKRHRDIMFYGKKNKPISIILTTLAGKAYKGESNILEGLVNVISTMELYIEKRNGKDFVVNPTNPAENFADRWSMIPEKKENFYAWLTQAKQDIGLILSSRGSILWENIGNSFGRSLSESANKIYTSQTKSDIKNGTARIATTGIIGSLGQKINASNTFYGKE